MNNLFSVIKNHWISILIITVIAVIVSVGITAVQPFEYRSTFSVLVIEKTNSADAFAAAKSAERASLSLAQILYTTSFYDQVRESGLLDGVSFPPNESERRNVWEHAIETRAYPDVGILKIAAYSPEKEKASALSFAVATVLTKNGTEYLGSGENIVLKIVDAPLTSAAPVRPSIPMNLAIGFIVGLGGAIGFHLIRELQAAASAQAAETTHQQMQPWPTQEVSAPAATPQPTFQPPMPVVTTMFSPEAMARMHQPQAPEQVPPFRAPDSWEMPDIRHGNPW